MSAFKCPKCGADLSVTPGSQIAKCQFCDTVTYVDRSEALFYYLLPFTIDEGKVRGIFKRWSANPEFDKDLEISGKITSIKKEYFPVFQFRRTVSGKEKVIVKPARGTMLPGMHNLEIPPGSTVVFDNTVKTGDAAVLQPDITIQSYLPEIEGQTIDQALVYFPIFEIKYSFKDQEYEIVIDGSSGKVYSGPAPARSSASYVAVMGLSFVIALISGILTITVTPIAIVLCAGSFFAGRILAGKVVEKKPAAGTPSQTQKEA